MHRIYCGFDKYLPSSQAEKVFCRNVSVDASVLNLAGKLLKMTDCSKYRFPKPGFFCTGMLFEVMGG